MLQVGVGRAQDDVDPGPFRGLDGLGHGHDIRFHGPCEGRDHGAFDLLGDVLDRGEVTGRGRGETRFDHVDAEFGQLVRDLDLLVPVQRGAGDLLPVTQRGVEDIHFSHRRVLL